MRDNPSEKLEYAESQHDEAKQLVREVEDQVDDATSSYPQMIRDCQEAVEISVKAMFFALDLDPPEKEHGISFDNAHPLITADVPESFEYKKSDIPRAVFLTQFWNEFYLVAKYGDEKRNIPPTQLFEREDVKLAVSHADFCRKVCSRLINARKNELRESR